MKLSTFLKKHGAYDAFICNFNRYYDPEVWGMTQGDAIGHAFFWHDSIEGFSFWDELDTDARETVTENDMQSLTDEVIMKHVDNMITTLTKKLQGGKAKAEDYDKLIAALRRKKKSLK